MVINLSELRKDRGIVTNHKLSKHLQGNKRSVTHGLSKTPAYGAWRRMMNRCYSPRDISHKHYGKRGISVCARWHNLHNFIEDMGQPGLKLTLERKNNNGNYEPNNCRWAYHQEQQQNKTDTKLNPMAVKVIRYLALAGVKQAKIAKAYHIDVSLVSRVKHKKYWGNISDT